MKHPQYDIDDLKRVPILLVAEKLGLLLVKTGTDTWQPRENGARDKVSSLTLFGKTNNFVRFSGQMSGGCDKGSTIDLVMHVTDNSDFKTACEYLMKFL